MRRSEMREKEREITSQLTKIVHQSEYIRGNLITMARVCGNANCRCIREGKKHTSLYLSISKKGKQRLIYIPKDLEQTVKSWVSRYHEIKRLLEVVSEINRKRLLEKKKGG